MTYPVSGCTFIRDTIVGAFCLFESMASLLPFVDDMCILDLGSTDGTWELLCDIAAANMRVTVIKGQFSRTDASAFADAANDCIALGNHDNVLFWQADEIWHEKLLARMGEHFERGEFDLSFWRYQLRDNFQRMKWFPHPVHRVGNRKDGKFNFVNDGMNSDRTWDAKLCAEHDGGWFLKWGGMDPLTIPVRDMIMDVSLVGGFRDNIVRRRALHAPMWHESSDIEGKNPGQWHQRALQDPIWTKQDTPYNIPRIMRWHVGRVTYDVRPDLIDALKNDSTREYMDAI